MFEKQKSQLFETRSISATSTQTTNKFVKAALQKSAETLSGNFAKKYKTTGNPFVDQFTFLGSYKAKRTFADIEKDCELLWSTNQLTAVEFILYIRMITRVISLFDGSKTAIAQKGAELKHEGIMRMIWLHTKQPKTFWKNIGLFVSVGSWKDIIQMLQYDLMYHGWDDRQLDWNKFGNLILSGLENDQTVNLIKKYLPQIKSKSACHTIESQADNMIGKWICSLVFGNKESALSYKKYRQLKTSGTAHEWQKLISQGKHQLIDFNSIHGRALNKLVRSKYLTNQGLKDKYEAWVTKDDTKVKYTGFVHELFEKLPSRLSSLTTGEQTTINKQFETLVEKARMNDVTSLIVVRDTSSSMGSTAEGTNMSCFDIGKALALFFSSFLKGEFSDAWIEFHSTSTMHEWKGNTPLERWYNDHSNFVGSTNFQSVINLFAKMKKQGIAESDFPTGILCISDDEFNPAALGQTNVETALDTLRSAGFSDEYVDNFVIVLWNLQSNYYGSGTGKKFETYGDVQNVFYFSGYSASTVSFLTEKIKNASELFESAMNQEILQMIEI